MNASGEERYIVPMPHIKVKSMHGFTVKELAKIIEKSQSPYTRRILSAVVMTANEVPSEVITKTLGCSHATVCRYVHLWNEHGLEGARDHRGGSVGRLADEMLKDIDDAVRHRSPKDHGY
ncbi:MAG: helix-turn-helix domain-containing protein [Firmicutes bacterium]|nr:helix-turn-helix domain-containing protein [Bacillota bacterium]